MRRLALCLLLLAAVAAQRPPQCPNGQPPKKDGKGKLIQCLPGFSQRLTCGASHDCFFTGLNYMCCPSNVLQPHEQPSCPSPHLTVLGGDGTPMRCSPRTRTCPESSMFCADVGSAYVCCEKSIVAEPVEEAPAKPPGPEESLECPGNSIGVLNVDGSRKICNSQRSCGKRSEFCYGEMKRSICCERYDTASYDEPTTTKKTTTTSTTTTTTEAPLSQEQEPAVLEGQIAELEKELTQVSVQLNRQVIDRTTPEMNRILDDNSAETRKELLAKLVSADVIDRDMVDKERSAEVAPPAPRKKKTRRRKTTTTTTTTSAPMIEDSADLSVIEELSTRGSILNAAPPGHSPRPSKRLPQKQLGADEQFRYRMHGVRTASESQFHKVEQGGGIFSTPEKRVMAQQFLLHQIRNGWPYDDRYYRPDAEAFTPEQRRAMADIHFSDN